MENRNWYENVEKQIGLLKDKMPKSDYSSYELNSLQRIAKRISSLSDECSQCVELKEKITNAINSLVDWPNTTKVQKDNYVHTFRTIVNHFEVFHPLGNNTSSRVGYIIAKLVFGCSFLLGCCTVFLSFSEVIGESTTISLIVPSGILFVLSIVAMAMFNPRAQKKPQVQSRDDSH